MTPTSSIRASSETSRLGNPEWYGWKYPSEDDLVDFGDEKAALVIWYPGRVAAFLPETESEAAAIFVPQRGGNLSRCWVLAHELGHLVQHSGPRGEMLWGKDERQADRWAACAMIPEEAVVRYRNACVDSFIAALWAHYENFQFEDCPSRSLAGRIAGIRLACLNNN